MRFLRTFFVEINRKYIYNISMGKRTYEQVLYEINNARRFGNAPGVEIIGKILQILRKTENDLGRIPFVHIAGTNGKGSVCAFLDTIFQKAGYCTGRFTSPHLIEFEERITVDGKMIPKAAVERIGNMLLDADFGISLTMFDYCLMMALIYFKECGCGIMIIETGLGGRLDSTNAIGTPLAEVITKIGYDHMAILGSDIRDIAAEKAGIIKEGTIVISEPQTTQAAEVLKKSASDKNAHISFVTDEEIEAISHRKIGLAGTYQLENAACALKTAKILLENKGMPDEQIEKITAEALKQTVWPGRMEVLADKPFLLVDGAHNSNGVMALKSSLENLYPGEKFVFFMGVMADKDYPLMIDEILPLAKCFITVTPDSDRALDSKKLAEFIRNRGIEVKCLTHISDIFDMLSSTDKNIAFGSLYFIGELKEKWESINEEHF